MRQIVPATAALEKKIVASMGQALVFSVITIDRKSIIPVRQAIAISKLILVFNRNLTLKMKDTAIPMMSALVERIAYS